MVLARRLVGFVVVLIAVVAVTALPAVAHTGFDSSDPPDGGVSDGPVSEIMLVFTGVAEPAGEGFQVLDAAGTLRAPTEATTADGLMWVLRFDPPLDGGTVGVRWSVKAPDAHPIEGTFSFTTPAKLAAADPVLAVDSEAADQGEATDLEAFLAAGGDSGGPTWAAAAARVIGLSSAMLGLGSLVFAGLVIRGDGGDIRFVLYWIRRSGVLLVVSAIVEFVAQVAVAGGGSWSSLWSLSALGDVAVSSLGLAIGLRGAGGFALASGARLGTTCATKAPDPVAAIKELVGAGAGAGSSSGGWPANFVTDGADLAIASPPYSHEGDRAWSANGDSAGAFIGAAAIMASFLFDGHTVSKGHRFFTGVVDVIHVAGAAVWAGGLVMLASVLWRRRRRGEDLRALQLAIRFSVVAAGALAAVGAAGIVLAIIVLDYPGELWLTPWGRLLMAKTVLVGIAAAGGAYNHLVLIPALEAVPDDHQLGGEFRTAVTAEAIVLGLVVVLTAFLVGAAS